jgi:hypothetical protein
LEAFPKKEKQKKTQPFKKKKGQRLSCPFFNVVGAH